VSTSKKRCDPDVGTDQGTGCPSARAPATLCTVPMVSGAGYSLGAAHMCLQKTMAEEKLHGNRVGTSEEPRRETGSTVARASGVLDVAPGRFEAGWKENCMSHKKISAIGLTASRPHDGCNRANVERCRGRRALSTTQYRESRCVVTVTPSIIVRGQSRGIMSSCSSREPT
jgi:hypothetical protein